MLASSGRVCSTVFMSNDLDAHAEAFAAAMPGFSPKGLMEALDDPTVFRDLARADLYVQFILLREQMKNPDIPVEKRLKYTDALQKIARLPAHAPEDTQRADRPMIQIVFSGNSEQSLDIEAESAHIVSEDD